MIATRRPAPASSDGPGPAIDGPRLLRVGLAGVGLALPAVIGRGAVAGVAGLLDVATPMLPDWRGAVPLHVWAAAVVLSSLVLLLLPGLYAVLAWGRARTASEWLLAGLTASLLIVSVAAAAVQAVVGVPVRDGLFVGVVAGAACAAWLAAAWRVRRGARLAWPMADAAAPVTLALAVIVPCLLLIALWPKFFWESFNGDGVHAYESARLLLVQPLPFWPATAGAIAAFPGTTSVLFVFPSSWFIRLFGELEVSARLAFLLYLVALHAAIAGLSEQGGSRRLRASELGLVWLAVAIYAVVMAYSATYSPYAADIALPATQDTLFLICVLAYVRGFAAGWRGSTVLYLVLAYLSLPSGPLVIGMWLAAVVATWRPLPWRAIRWSVAALAACVAGAVLLPSVLTLAGWPAPGREYALGELAKRFAYLQVSDWRRLGFVILPGGILPALSLLAWRRHDHVSRALALVTVLYAAFFFFPYQTALHYFVPAMVLPIVVFWRLHLMATERHRPRLLAASAACSLVALWLSLPSDPAPDLLPRVVGSALEVRGDGYAQSHPDSFRRCGILYYLFPLPWDPTVPDERYGGSALQWNYYGHLPPRGRVNYVLQGAGDRPPAGMRLMGSDGDAAVYLRSEAEWAAHLALRPSGPAGSRAYLVPKSMLFRAIPPPGEGPVVIDTAAVLASLGIDVEPLLARFGITR